MDQLIRNYSKYSLADEEPAIFKYLLGTCNAITYFELSMRSIWISMLTFIPYVIFAQWQAPQFDVFTAENGMQSNRVWGICQDSLGYLYFALNDQVIRYDGMTFKEYTYNPKDSLSISAGQVVDMYYSRKYHKIWMAMRRGGICSFDPISETFERFDTPSKALTKIVEDRKGNIWIGTGGPELLKFDPTTGLFSTFQPNGLFEDPTTWGVYTIVPDLADQNHLWVSFSTKMTFPGTFSSSEQLTQFNSLHGTFKLAPCPISSMYIPNNNHIVGGSWQSGLWLYDIKSKQSQNFRIDTTFPNGLQNYSSVFDIIKYKSVYWATSFNAIYTFTEYQSPQIIYDLNKHIRFGGFFIDHENNLWVTSNEGLHVCSAKKQYIDYFNLSIVNQVDPGYVGHLAYSTQDNSIFLTGSSAIYQIPLDRRKDAVKITTQKLPQTLTSDGKDRIWVTLDDNRLYLLDYDDKQLKLATTLGWPEIRMNQIFELSCPDGNHLIALNSRHIYWMDTRNPEWHEFTIEKDPEDCCVYAATIDTNLNSLLANAGHYLYTIDLSDGTWKRMETEFNNAYFIKHPMGTYWAIDVNHLGRFTEGDERLTLDKYYSAIDGINVTGGYFLHLDYKNRIWAFGESGASVIDASSGRIHNIGVSEGLPTITIDPLDVLNLPDHRMVVPNSNGIIFFHPDSLWNATEDSDHAIVINAIRVNGKWIKPELFHSKNPLELKPYENYLEFEFQGIDFPHSQNLKYAYTIEGLTDGWISLGKRNTLTLARIPSGNYFLKLIVGDTLLDASQHQTTLAFNILTPLHRRPGFIFLISTIMAGFLIWMYRFRINQIRKTEMQKTNYQKQIAELEMQTLRVQMNPHFMFNSLNSIKNYILKNDRTKSAEYLSSFAHLIRLILQNSREENISLQQELDTLLLYVELEQIRFRHQFVFTCDLDPNIDTEHVFVPPMIIMPYVENAIWHGLLHKASDRNLSIKLYQEDKAIFGIIEDNGIGRIQAQQLKSKSISGYKSMGMRITKDRIDLLNSLHSTNITIDVYDKYNDQNEALGTIVKIKFPYENHNY